ncbi:MAG: DUF4296 domain-containing protein [Sphingobacteriia bacterium]|jgi:hypothetical protein|nr:MAG: DUF4296 domain-containing protein [Sphingobacteriia bacterium]
MNSRKNSGRMVLRCGAFTWVNPLCLVCILFFFACSHDRAKSNEKVLPVNTMKQVVWDMLRADEYYLRKTQFDSLHRLDQENFRYYEQVFRAHGVNRKQFYESWKWYQSHPTVFQLLIDSVDALGMRQRNEANRRFGAPPTTPGSSSSSPKDQ